MNQIWSFDQGADVQSAFAVTLAARGGEQLHILDDGGECILSVHVELDRKLKLECPSNLSDGKVALIALPGVVNGNGVGYQIEFGKDCFWFFIDRIPCFSGYLPAGCISVRSVAGLGEWMYPCVWSVPQPVRAPARIIDSELPPVDSNLLRPLALKFGADHAELIDVEGEFLLVVEQDIVKIHQFEEALGTADVRRSRAYLNCGIEGYGADAENTTRNLPLEHFGMLVNYIEALIVNEGAGMDFFKKLSDRNFIPTRLTIPLSGGIIPLVLDAGFNAFSVFRKRTIEQLRTLSPKPRARRARLLNADGLKALSNSTPFASEEYILECIKA